MLQELVNNKVYCGIFDKTYHNSTRIYAKYKADNENQIEEINRNLTAIKSEFNAKDMLILTQTHGNKVVDADDIDNFSENEPEGDAAITTKSEVILSIRTADCVPVLLYSNNGMVIGAAHCSWKSAKANIIDKVISSMEKKGAKQINAVIGPAIQQYSYEVDSKYYNEFIEDDANYAIFFLPSPRTGKYMFDLPHFVNSKLQSAGVINIIQSAEDTYSNPQKYPSFRRNYHQAIEGRGDNILSAIVIKNV